MFDVYLSRVLLFALGTAVGSFINVLSLRYLAYYDEGVGFLSEKVARGRSRCPSCGAQLRWWEMIPILSYFFLRARCRLCRASLSFQYPLVEFLGGAISLLVPYRLYSSALYNFLPASAFFLICFLWVVIFFLFLLLSVLDFRASIIPNQVNLSLAVLGLALAALLFVNPQLDISNLSLLGHYSLLFGWSNNIIWDRIAASISGMIFLGAIIALTKGRGMGWGDFKLIGAIGLIFGWSDTIVILALAFLLGGLVGGFLILRKKKGMKDAVPFGPFLAIAASLVFFFGYQIADFYFKLVGIYGL